MSPHPFAQYPYIQRTNVGAGYVGPAWAAPAPYRQPPRRKRGIGCGGCALGAIGTLVVSVVVIALALVLCSAIAAGPPPPPAPTTGDPTRPRIESRDDASWGGTCVEFDQERNRSAYQAYRGSGSARRLQGKIALLHFRLKLPNASFGTSSVVAIDAAAIAAKEFYLRQAERLGAQQPSIDLVSWPLSTPARIPALQPDRHGRIDPETQKKIRTGARQAIELAVDSSLEALVRSYRTKGYDEVGFLVYLPIDTQARAFAWFAATSSSGDFADAGYIFAEKKAVGALTYLVAHEGLHLFGADDLYRVAPRDANDAKDLMNDTCSGLGEARIGESSAFAIGWTSRPPVRRYSFVEY